MLFNTYIFLFLFLPVSWLGFRLLSKYRYKRLAVGWIIVVSALFYMYWNPFYLLLLLLSVSCNFFIGRYLSGNNSYRMRLLALGIFLNLLLLGYFKYMNFFIDTVNAITGQIFLDNIVGLFLPLGISFWTFQQISYIVDVYYNRNAAEQDGLYYFAYIFFFPHLIAGPIVRHGILINQLKSDRLFRLSYRFLVVGLCFLAVGLFKKVVIADSLSPWVINIFDGKGTYSLADAWIGALAYTLQIYFDFSGYSDMAIGLAKFFNIDLPINFNSPYKSKSIIEFWRRWHITLSTFLRDYLYIPLGGKYQRYRNLLITMLLGGLWHGAGWTFIFWGGGHGVLLCINHYWNNIMRHWNKSLPGSIAWLITFGAIMSCWVLFRANSLEQAGVLLLALTDYYGWHSLIENRRNLIILLLLVVACRFLPETWEFVQLVRDKKSILKVMMCFVFMLTALYMMNKAPTEFLYFQF